jgi:hypothetical protein
MMIDHGQDTDVLEPEPARKGGLLQKDMVSPLLFSNRIVHNRMPATYISQASSTSRASNAASVHLRS